MPFLPGMFLFWCCDSVLGSVLVIVVVDPVGAPTILVAFDVAGTELSRTGDWSRSSGLSSRRRIHWGSATTVVSGRESIGMRRTGVFLDLGGSLRYQWSGIFDLWWTRRASRGAHFGVACIRDGCQASVAAAHSVRIGVMRQA